MTTKQILLSAFLLGAINNIGLALESNPSAKRFNQENARRFDKGTRTCLQHSKDITFWESAHWDHLNSNNYIELIEITYDNKEIKRGTIKELKANPVSSEFGKMWNAVGGIWDPINRNNAFFDPLKQAIFYGNALEKDPSLRKMFQLIEKAIELTNKKLLRLNQELADLVFKKEEHQHKNLIKEIENIKQKLNVLRNTHNSL